METAFITITIILSLVETGFAADAIIKRQRRTTLLDCTRLGGLAVTGVCLLAGWIPWTFRWYAPLALLSAWGLLAAWRLVRARTNRAADGKGKEAKTWHIVFRAAGNLLLLFVALIPALVFPQHDLIETTGQYRVGTAYATYTDERRMETYSDTGAPRTLNVAFWYPEGDGVIPHTYPLIVFSHGSFGVKTSNTSLYHELASHGYVVCSIDHTYQALFTTHADGSRTWIDPGYLQEVSRLDAHNEREQAFAYFQQWMQIRTGDIQFVIDTILARGAEEDADPVTMLVDTAKIGVMGHSLGGSAALGIGRMRDDISAVIALESPFLTDITAVENDEFVFTDEPYPVPVLNIYSDASWEHLDEWAQYAENAALLSDASIPAYHAYLRGAGHLTLTDLVLTSPILANFLNQQKTTADERYTLALINQICLAFFDSTLKGIGSFSMDGTFETNPTD
ncbi:MAG: alpha/beta hydrolase [Anaerolineae bacterium]|nr:alpha/beta hydrolase [Anaerolineae bacterium]